MYRYIGNKTRLLPHILASISKMIGNNGIVADIMAGTGTVSLALRKLGYKVVASDVMTYSYHHLVTQLILGDYPKFSALQTIVYDQKSVTHYRDILKYLNSLSGTKGYFYNEFAPEGKPANGCPARKYFTSENASKIDAIRETINQWIETKLIDEYEESLLKHTLIMAVNEVANISGTYGYFLSKFSKNSMNPICLQPIDIYTENKTGHSVRLGYAEDLASSISADLCYIDPPYMKRQYAANYHILETIARGDFPEARGKSGLRNWWDQHSKLCTKTQGLQSFEQILQNMHCNKFLISYSEDGLFSLSQLIDSFKKYGTVEVQRINYNRFRSNSSDLPLTLKEYLISVER